MLLSMTMAKVILSLNDACPDSLQISNVSVSETGSCLKMKSSERILTWKRFCWENDSKEL